jgi:outer membrane biosynthesis protein TonB
MTAHAEILEERDPVRGSFFAAVALHVALFGGVALVNWILGNRPTFGAPDAGGAAVGVEAVKSLPLPHEGEKNPVAKLKGPEPKKNKATQSRPRFRSYDELMPNQLTSSQPQAVSNPAFSAMPGSGRIGAGPNTMLGSQFAAYAAQVQQIIAQKWRTGDVDAKYKTAPTVIATFEIQKDGSVRGVGLLQKSGISSLDYSVERAILEANLPPLPQEFPRSSAKVELSFELKR